MPVLAAAAAAPFLPAIAFAIRPTTPLFVAVPAVLAAVLALLLTMVVPALLVEEAVLAALGTRGYDIAVFDAAAVVVRTLVRVAVVAVVFPVVTPLAPRLERADEAVVAPVGLVTEAVVAVVRDVCLVLAVRVRVEAAVARSLPLT